MANEVATKNSFSTDLTVALAENKAALPENFNSARFVQNSVALLNGNEILRDFAQKHGTAQIKMGLLRGAYLGLDALNQEMYLVPYGSTLNFMASYTGMIKLVKMYSQRPVQNIYAKVVRDGEPFECGVEGGKPYVNHKENPFSNADIVGVYAVCQFDDGGLIYDVMSKEDVEKTRNQSKAKNSPAWQRFWTEMAKKSVIRRLCKTITMNMDSRAKEMFEAGLEIETDPAEIAKAEIEENANQEEFVIDAEIDEEGSEEGMPFA